LNLIILKSSAQDGDQNWITLKRKKRTAEEKRGKFYETRSVDEVKRKKENSTYGDLRGGAGGPRWEDRGQAATKDERFSKKGKIRRKVSGFQNNAP